MTAKSLKIEGLHTQGIRIRTVIDRTPMCELLGTVELKNYLR